MKRILLAGLIVLGWASMSRADLIIAASRTPNITKGNGTYDQITFTLSSLTGADTQTGPSGQAASVIVLQGTFTATGAGAALAVPGDSNSPPDDGFWENFITPARGGQRFLVNGDTSAIFTYASSNVKLPNLVTALVSRTGTGSATFDSSGNAATMNGDSTALSGDWFANGGSAGVTPGTALAQIFVTPGADVTFAGTYSSWSTNTAPLTFSSVPEPTSISLAGAAVCGLLLRRRR